MHIRTLALALLALSGCDCGEGIVTRPPPCEGAVFRFVRYQVDDVQAEQCSEVATAAPTGSPPTQWILLGGGEPCSLPAGFNGGGLSLYNIPLVRGESGHLVGGQSRGPGTFPAQIGADHEGRHAEIRLALDLPGGRDCPTADDALYSIGGTYRVIQGGGPGDTVEVEARDVEFLPAPDGRQFRFDWMYWRAVVRDVHDPPVPSPPRDSGL